MGAIWGKMGLKLDIEEVFDGSLNCELVNKDYLPCRSRHSRLIIDRHWCEVNRNEVSRRARRLQRDGAWLDTCWGV